MMMMCWLGCVMELDPEMGELYSVNIEIQLYKDEASTKTWFLSYAGHISKAQSGAMCG